MTSGTIFNIEEFAVHDGPGIRKLVFFKGCNLRCSWCHNPEGISFGKELMVSESLCINCRKCREACRNDECIACGDCTKVCPLNLRKISGTEYESGDLAKLLLKGIDIINSSGGGITISGGEPLAQPDFLFELIGYLKPVHIAVETSAFAAKDIFRKMVAMADLILMDIKHMDSLMHRKYTGAGNELIIENLNYLCSSGKTFTIRIPLIPGVNDTLLNMQMIASALKDTSNLTGVEMLPYHKTAPAKYRMLGKNYNPGFNTERKAEIHLAPFKKYNIKTSLL